MSRNAFYKNVRFTAKTAWIEDFQDRNLKMRSLPYFLFSSLRSLS
jgi:hypothetical protein